MTRKRSIFLAVLLGVAISASSLAEAAAPICTPAGVIRQRFINDGGQAQVVADPRGVAVVSGAILDGNSSPTTADAYLVVGIAGLVLVYRIDGLGQMCGGPPVVIRGSLAGNLIKRLREVE